MFEVPLLMFLAPAGYNLQVWGYRFRTNKFTPQRRKAQLGEMFAGQIVGEIRGAEDESFIYELQVRVFLLDPYRIQCVKRL